MAQLNQPQKQGQGTRTIATTHLDPITLSKLRTRFTFTHSFIHSIIIIIIMSMIYGTCSSVPCVVWSVIPIHNTH